LAGEGTDATFENVNLLDSTGLNFRADEVSTFAPRTRRIRYIKGKIAGADNAIGVSLAHVHSGFFHQTQVGYNETLGDAAAEATQTIGFNCGPTAENCEFRSCTVAVASGLAYVNAGTSDRGNNIVSPRGNATHTTNGFALDGVARQTQTALEDIAGEINTTRKSLGKQVFDTTNNVLRFATGSAAGDSWIGADGSAAIVP
jgi:hypothetical protein